MNRRSYSIVLALIASVFVFSTLTFLTGCGSSSSTTTTPPVTTIAATSGSGQSAVVGAAFTNPLVATVMSGTTPASGVTVTLTAPYLTDGEFATTTPGITDTETTNSSGVATSKVFTAGTLAGSYTVTVTTSGAATPASFSLTNTAGAAVNLTIPSANGGNYQGTTFSTPFPNPLVAQVTDSDGNGVQGISVTFTINPGSTGASGSFTGGGNAEGVNTDANGNATVSGLVANATIGSFTVTASSTGFTSVNFTETNMPVIVPILAAGNYVYYLSGEDNFPDHPGIYFVTGVFTVLSSGAISVGEQTFSDFYVFRQDTVYGNTSSIVKDSNGNLLISLDTRDPGIGVNGVETFDASMVTASNGLLTEYDAWASGSGTLELQTSMAPPSGGYAFFTAGLDRAFPPSTIVIGGVINVNSAGGIPGAGSVFDENDGGTLSSDQLFLPGTVVGPDFLGQVTFNLKPKMRSTTVADFEMVGYIVDANHIRWVEDWNTDSLGAYTGGFALGQNGKNGTYSSSDLSGFNAVFGAAGDDPNGALQVAGLLTFNSDGSVGGNLSFNDFFSQTPQGGVTLTTGGTWALDASGIGNDGGTGRVTISNVTYEGATSDYNFRLYLADGAAVVISMDTFDEVAGLGYPYPQTDSFTSASFSGNYTLNIDQEDTSDDFEYDGVGTVTANGAGAFTGSVDLNVDLTPTTGTAGGVTGTFTHNANGVFPGTISGISSSGKASDDFTFYLIGATSGASPGVIGIENDTDQLTLGTFELQQ